MLAFHGNVQNNKLTPDDPESMAKHIATLNNKKVTITITPFRKPRSGAENRYYHGVVVSMLADEFSFTPEEMHEALKLKFLLDKTRKIPTVKSTAQLSTVEFETYLSQIRIWASKEYQIDIPNPNETI